MEQRTSLTKAEIRRQQRYIRPIAMAMARNSRAGLQELAAISGVSRATLYRIASSREELLSILTRHAVDAAQDALEKADLTQADPLAALTELTRLFMQDDQFYLHIVVGSPDFSPMLTAQDAPDTLWAFYNDALAALFARGQAQGLLRGDMDPRLLRIMYDAMMLAAVTADLSGHLAQTDRLNFVMQAFLQGAGRAG